MKHYFLGILFLTSVNTASAGFISIITKALTHSADEAAEAGIQGSKRFVDDLHIPKQGDKLIPDSQVSRQSLDTIWADVAGKEISFDYFERAPRSLSNQTRNPPEFPRFIRWWGARHLDDATRIIDDFKRSLNEQRDSDEDPQPIGKEKSFNPDSLFNPIIKETISLKDNSDYATNIADMFDVLLLGNRYMGLDPYDVLIQDKLSNLDLTDYLYLDTSLMAMLKARDQSPENFKDQLDKSAEFFFDGEYAEILRPYGCLALLNTSAMTKWYVHHGSEEIFKTYCDYKVLMDDASRLSRLTPEDLQMNYSNSEEMQQFIGIKSMQVVAPMIFTDEVSYYEFRNNLMLDMQQIDISTTQELVLPLTTLLATAEIRFGNHRNAYDLARLVFMESLKHRSKENIPSAVFVMGESLLRSGDYSGAFEMGKLLEKLSNRNSEFYIPAENKIFLASYLVALEGLWNDSI